LKKPLIAGQFFPEKNVKIVAELLKKTLTPNQTICQGLYDRGERSFMHAFCTTKLTHHQLNNGKVWSPAQDVLAFALPVHFPEGTSVDRLKFYPLLKEDYLESQVTSYSRKVEGDIMSLNIVSKKDEFPIDTDLLFEQTIAKLRLMGGIGAIVDVIQVKSVELPSGKSFEKFIGSESLPYWYFRSPHQDNSWNSVTNSFRLNSFSLSKEALRLFSLSIRQTDSSTQFLLLWLALESQIGRGPKMKQFFQGKYACDEIVTLIPKLSKIRGDFVHKGKIVDKPFSLEFLFLLFRLSCIRDAREFKVAEDHLKSLRVELVF
jgi:hypothetical protein